MAEPITWLPDGTPYSPRFQDRYRSELGGLSQAREVFLQGCGLPQAWGGASQWRILETGFGLGLNFLVTWDAWRRDPARPRLLHFVSIEAWPASAEDLLHSYAAHPELLPLARQLHAQWWGLLPGWHRLVFEDGQLVLTLCIGEAGSMVREMAFAADTVYLDGFSPERNPDIWSTHTMKAVARCCRRGTSVATWTVARGVRDALKQAGFVMQKTEGVPPKRHNLQGRYDPHWTPRAAAVQAEPMTASHCIVVGGGIAGAAVANSLARRGWAVQVLDAGAAPAAGASGLPAGLVAPHVSADDNVLSQLSRAGVRATLQCAERLLQPGTDWAASGVLQHHLGAEPDSSGQDGADPGSAWGGPATAAQIAQAGLPAGSAAHWHAKGAWLQPRRLVQALLAHEGITWRGGYRVAGVRSAATTWQVLDEDGTCLAEAPLVVMATGAATGTLAGVPLPLQPVRGQVSWAPAGPGGDGLPAFPVNGNGSFIPAVPTADGPIWVAGASFDRHQAEPVIRPEDHALNLVRLASLLPATAVALGPVFDSGGVQAWAGVRCASPDRLPVVGEVQKGLWVSTAMGSRGLTFAVLCGELLAAQVQGEPWPLPRRLGAAVGVGRFLG